MNDYYIASIPTAQGETAVKSNIFRNITILDTALDPSTAIAFETGVSPLDVDALGVAPPSYVNTPIVKQAIDFQDANLIVVNNDFDSDSDVVDSVTGHYKFKLYLGNVINPPDDGIFRVHFEITEP